MADYRLTAGDIATFPVLFRIQEDIGPGISPLTQAGVWDFMGQLDVLARQQYPQIQNAQLKAWVDGVFTPLSTTPSVSGDSFTAHYLAASCGRWLREKMESGDPDYKPDSRIPLAYADDFLFLRTWPDTPGYWHKALDAQFFDWMSPHWTPEALFWKVGSTVSQQVAYQEALFDPSRWTEVSTVSHVVGTIGEAQAAAVHALLTGGALSPDSALFLPYLLLGVITSVTDQRLAAKILSVSASSPEYPNDTFANQLVYLMLMTLADPLGNFAWPNAALQSTVQSMIAAIQHDDPASVALKRSLTSHLKVLVVDSAYPTQDLYNPNISFPVRQTDTLAALNRAWATLRTT
jgi:hypothetical protein